MTAARAAVSMPTGAVSYRDLVKALWTPHSCLLLLTLWRLSNLNWIACMCCHIPQNRVQKILHAKGTESRGRRRKFAKKFYFMISPEFPILSATAVTSPQAAWFIPKGIWLFNCSDSGFFYNDRKDLHVIPTERLRILSGEEKQISPPIGSLYLAAPPILSPAYLLALQLLIRPIRQATRAAYILQEKSDCRGMYSDGKSPQALCSTCLLEQARVHMSFQ
ncbi:hypothetical protein STEG23_004747, partial [Scotinomys teguina]